MNKGNKLKAAIEAAMLKKPGLYRKKRVPDQPEELSVLSMNGEIASQGPLSGSNSIRNMISDEDMHEGQAVKRDSTTDSCMPKTVNNMEQFSVLPAEVVTSRTEDVCPIVRFDGKSSSRDLHCYTLASISPLLKLSAIPEHEFIWQGAFEIHRSGQVSDLLNGMQAHLSIFASHKVLEAANKFSCKLTLNEVPRMSTWPIQFQESDVKEDNIALYFFAKDLESYEKSYKILLDSMMSSDLALKGIIDGVELLIFPSNQLPEKYQRWNMLFFLWGVFRGKRASCLQHMPGSTEQFSCPQDISMATISLPENTCSLGPIDNSSSACDGACNVDVASEAHASIALPCLSEGINGDCDTKVSSLVTKDECIQIVVEQQEFRLDSDPLSTIQSSSAHLCPGLGSICISQSPPPCCIYSVTIKRVCSEKREEEGILHSSVGANLKQQRRPGLENRVLFLFSLLGGGASGGCSPASEFSLLGCKHFSRTGGVILDVSPRNMHSINRKNSLAIHACDPGDDISNDVEGYVDPDCKKDEELNALEQVTRPTSGSNKIEMMPMHWDTPHDRQQASSHYFNKIPAAMQEVEAAGVIGEENITDKMNRSKDQVKFRGILEERGILDAGAALEGETVIGDATIKELNAQYLNHRKRPHIDSTELMSQAAGGGKSQIVPWNGVNAILADGSENKKQKTGFGGFYGCNNPTDSLRDGFASMHEVASSSSIKEKRYDESCGGTVIPDNSQNAERYFFPVDSPPVKDIGLGDNSMPWKMFLPGNEDGLHDRTPNLELALGAETSSRQGIPPFLGGKVDKKKKLGQPPDKATSKEEEEEVSAALSLSLSFPIPDKKQAAKPVSKSEQLHPERRLVNTSLFLFGGLSDK
ncbi:unnamed protein product [Ilex paraguariensis]|uniref:AIPP2-like SPOC-like domain-containing protein n=1 Tax=Ilex paraguariensis TaxID=185542 RepID=A0ABC8T9B8_9AQUA